jgi:hypothetical protein
VIRRLCLAAATLLLVAACGGSSTPPPDPSIVPVPTQAADAPGASPHACMTALAVGRLVLDSRWGLALGVEGGANQQVIWPFGWIARRTDGGLVLVNAKGTVVAREGNRIQLGGGHDGNGAWVTCGDLVVFSWDPPLSVANGTSLRVTVAVNGLVLATIQPGERADPIAATLPPRPWAIELRAPSGRVLAALTVAVDDPIGPTFGRASRVDLSCGRLEAWTGPPLLGGTFIPGPSGDCG